MTKRGRILVASLTGVLLFLSGSICAYVLRYGMTPAQSYERGSPSLAKHVLLATQGSVFKDRLVGALVAHLEKRMVYVKVIDVTALGDIDSAKWQAIVLVHSWEIGKPPRAVSDFVARAANPGRIIDVTTSGSGRETLPGIDAISSASIVDEVPALATHVTTKLDALLAMP